MPGLSAIGGRGKANVAAAPSDVAGPAGNVECGHDGAAPRKHVGLDFGLMVTVGVGEIVDADSRQSGLSARG